jgi:hypothetical protein
MISMPVPGMFQLINYVVMSFIYEDIFLSDKWMPQLFYALERVEKITNHLTATSRSQDTPQKYN